MLSIHYLDPPLICQASPPTPYPTTHLHNTQPSRVPLFSRHDHNSDKKKAAAATTTAAESSSPTAESGSSPATAEPASADGPDSAENGADLNADGNDEAAAAAAAEKKRREDFGRLTELADALLQAGQHDVYQQTKEDLEEAAEVAAARAARAAGSSSGGCAGVIRGMGGGGMGTAAEGMMRRCDIGWSNSCGGRIMRWGEAG